LTAALVAALAAAMVRLFCATIFAVQLTKLDLTK
jgi:hypothetical protein